MPKAKNPPAGAIIDYYLKSAWMGEITLDVVDKDNQLVRHYSSKSQPKVRTKFDFLISDLALDVADIWLETVPQVTTRAGMNRFVWDLRYPQSSDRDGPFVLPGTYEVQLHIGDRTHKQPLTVRLDPRSTAGSQELAEQLALGRKVSREMERVAQAIGELRVLRIKLQESKNKSPAMEAQTAAIDAEAQTILNSNLGVGLADVLSVVNSAERMPPAQAFALFEEATRNLNRQLDRWKALQAGLPVGLMAEVTQVLEAGPPPGIRIKSPEVRTLAK
jgi:hypothetical protein